MPSANSQYFDSCTHPTLNGAWTDGRIGTTFQDLARLRADIPGYKALAIGLPNVGNYEHGLFKQACETWGFEGIAAVTTVQPGHLEREIDEIKGLGFRGVKVHPRLLGENTSLSYLSRIFSLCGQSGLVCLLCTYEADKPGRLPSVDPFYQICDALNEVPEVRLILMHGGGLRLMQFASVARHSDTILIDLSFTVVDRMTAMLDPAIRELMWNFDRRICIGSDSPEFTFTEVLQRARQIAGNLDSTKLDNIFSNNLHRFFPN